MSIYRHTETIFEKITNLAVVILGNSITFILAFSLVIYWFASGDFLTQGKHESIRDLVHAITFLSVFIIQKSVNRHTALLHFKVNELLMSHEPANNAVIHAETKTEHEIIGLAKEHAELIVHEEEEEAKSKS
ncbi:MAG: low affinity iron permease family protein [Saprospiraceae bacterium]|nr:low affinity iron permease family protein [Saprospiraceae bacterium]